MKRLLLSGLAAACALGCGGASREATTTTNALQEQSSFAEVAVRYAGSGQDDGLTAQRRPSLAAQVTPILERASEHAVQFESNEALQAVAVAQARLEERARTVSDYDLLHRALTYRALIESNLEHPEQADAALRRAATLRPDAALDPVRFPPDLAERYRQITDELRAEPPSSIGLTSEPSGATVWVDGRLGGTTPMTVRTLRGQHYLRIEALTHSGRSITIEFSPQGARPLFVELPRATDEELALQLLERPTADDLTNTELEALSARMEHSSTVLLVEREEETERIELQRPQDSVLPPQEGAVARDEPSGVLESPWFWVITLGILAAGGTAAGFILLDSPDPALGIRSCDNDC